MEYMQMLSMLDQMKSRKQQMGQQQAEFGQKQDEYQRLLQQQQQRDAAQQRGVAATNAQIVGGPGAFDPNNPTDLATIMQEEPAYMDTLLQNQAAQALQAPGSQELGLQLLQEQRVSDNAGSSVFGQQLRGLGTDFEFLVHQYNDGKIPTNTAQLEEVTVRAAADPAFGERRQKWANDRTADKMSVVGVASDDPTQIIINDNKRGFQYRGMSGGDALAQVLKDANEQETNTLATYRDLYSVAEELQADFNETLTGPFDGNINRMASVFKGTPEYSTFKSKLDRLRTIVYGFSGKQINETELEWLTGLLPQIYNPDENFLAKLKSLQEWVADKQEAQLLEMKSARRHTGTKSLREKPVGVSDERLSNFKSTLDKKLGVISSGWTVDQATEAQWMEAYKVVGDDDAAAESYLNKKYGGK
jgi:hypothetical protein